MLFPIITFETLSPTGAAFFAESVLAVGVGPEAADRPHPPASAASTMSGPGARERWAMEPSVRCWLFGVPNTMRPPADAVNGGPQTETDRRTGAYRPAPWHFLYFFPDPQGH